MTEAELIAMAKERGGTVGPSLAESMSARSTECPKISEFGGLLEIDFQKAVLDLAKRNGWRTAHFRPGRTSNGGWKTAVAGDGKGFVDLVLVRERVVWAELKIPPNTLSVDQLSWRDALLAAGQEWYEWTPKDWQRIEEVLR
jgi:hypothetical protein